MALEIKKLKNVFLLEGRLGANQVFQVNAFFQAQLEIEGELTISLAGLDDLDISGAIMFKHIKDIASKTQRAVSIFAGENKKILGPFSVLEDPYVLAA